MSISLSSLISRLRDYINRAIRLPSDPNIAADFNPLALALFAAQFEAVPVYRRLCEERNSTPQNVSHWTQIPALPASAFKAYPVTSLAESERAHFFLSSGTTEQVRSRHYHDIESLSLYEASLLPWFKQHVTFGAALQSFKLMVLTPNPQGAPQSSLVHMFEVIRRDWGGDDDAFFGRLDENQAWLVDLDRVKEALSTAIQTDCPVAMLGTAFSFIHLLDHIENDLRACRLPRGSRILETGGYKGRSRTLPKAELHALMSKKLGIPDSHIISEYGMSELSSQAYDHKISAGSSSTDRVFRFPPWARSQIISPENGTEVREGETGLIRIFDLANARSVLAVQTEDLGIRRPDGFELLGRDIRAEPRGCSLMSV